MSKIKKAQEEMVGFVLIVVLVAIIAVVFLGLSLRQKQQPESSTKVDNLLSALLSYTTDCALYFPQYETVEDLMKSCYDGEKCSDGTETCKELQDVMANLLKSAQGDLSADRPVKAYELNVSYSDIQQGMIQKAPRGSILYVKSNACNSNSIGSQRFIPLESGNIIVSLKFCY